MTSEELLSIADSLVAEAVGSEQVEVVVEHSRETEVRVYEGAVEAFTSATSLGAGIRVVDGPRQGFAYCGTLDPIALRETLAEARDNSSFATPDEHAGLAHPDQVAPPHLSLYQEAIERTSPRAKIDLLIELERILLSKDARIVGTESVDYSDSIDTSVVVSTTGIRSSIHSSSCGIALYSLAEDGPDVTTGFGFDLARKLEDLDIERVASQAADRALQQLGASRTQSRRCTVVFDPWVSAQFLSIIGSCFSGTEIARGRSFLADRMSEAVAYSGLTLFDDPTDQRWFGAVPFDGEGLATRRNALLTDGVLTSYLLDSWSARAMNTVSNASAVRGGIHSTPGAGPQSLVIEPGQQSAEQIIAGVDDGLLITEVQGLHSGVNSVSGDFSAGIEGRAIRSGKLCEPIKEVTIASTLQRMLADITAIGSDLTTVPIDAVGVTMAIGDVMVSGDSA